jgi:cysteine desulfurase
MQTDLYLDANATSAVLPAAIDASERVMRELYGNPSSTHATGLKAKALLAEVRQCAARVLGTGKGKLVFTSGATESIQTAVLSALMSVREKQQRGEPCGSVLLYGATEHKAVPESLAHWNRLLGTNLQLRVLPVDQDGRHRLDVLRALAQDAALVCTMAANNETGVVSDIACIGAVLQQCDSRALWLVDSVQALGKLALDLANTRIDYAPFSGHKLYAPKGVGMLYVRDGAPFTPLMAGGGQEDGNRAGTENMAGIAALGAVLQALEQGATFRSHLELAGFRERVAAALRAALPGVVFNAPFDKSLPTTLNFSVPGVSSKELLDLFDAAGIRVSSGSACSSSKAAPSYVLEAMALPAWRSGAAVRMSFGPLADEAFIAAACERIARCGDALRASCMVPSDFAPASADRIISLSFEGEQSWMIVDQASHGCAIIDPHPALVVRIAAFVRCQQLQVHLIADTAPSAERRGARAVLQAELGSALAPGFDSCERVMLGPDLLLRVPHAMGASYLFGAAASNAAAIEPAAVRFAFCGTIVTPGCADSEQGGEQAREQLQAALQLAALVNADTVLCSAVDERNMICTTFGAESAGSGALGRALAADARLARPANAALAAERSLDAPALERFMASHPDALLIDVRELYEHAANGAPAWHGQAARSVPLSRLAGQLELWMHAAPRPLVFFCRAGNRSARAAQCAQRLGVANAWQVTGGLALGDAVLAPLSMAA